MKKSTPKLPASSKLKAPAAATKTAMKGAMKGMVKPSMKKK